MKRGHLPSKDTPAVKAAEHKRVLSFLRAVRGAFPDAAIVFTHGGCYGLYQILREVFTSAAPFLTEDKNHIVTQLSGRFYDIYGEYLDREGQPMKEKLTPLTPQQMERWSSIASGQRLEYMLKKYAGD